MKAWEEMRHGLQLWAVVNSSINTGGVGDRLGRCAARHWTQVGHTKSLPTSNRACGTDASDEVYTKRGRMLEWTDPPEGQLPPSVFMKNGEPFAPPRV